jgi:hypothetical protein
MVKPDAVALLTVPDAPPAAGPDRALDPPPPAVVEEDVEVVEGDAVCAEDVAQPANRATAAHTDAAAIHPRFGYQWFSMAFSYSGTCPECEPPPCEGPVGEL